ncbi:MAG: hypothetical protein ABIZ05_05185 [Pseudonocardiaceae bacterium]
MPNEPETTTLVDLAKEIGATKDEIDRLSPEVRQLTKGQLLALWGTRDTKGAIDAFHKSHDGSHLPSAKAISTTTGAPLHLTLHDVSSIQKIFTPERVRAALGSAGAKAGAAEAADYVSCCCCTPCCCSGSMLENTDVVT